MTTISLDPNDMRKAIGKLNDLDDLADILRKPMDRSLLKLQNRMALYPPPPPGSTYRRTGTLGRRWTTGKREVITATDVQITGRIGNNTEYGPRVQSKKFQTRAFKNRWQTDEDVAKSEEKWIRQQFSDALDDRAK